jgi:hypothetical protein
MASVPVLPIRVVRPLALDCRKVVQQLPQHYCQPRLLCGAVLLPTGPHVCHNGLATLDGDYRRVLKVLKLVGAAQLSHMILLSTRGIVHS